MENIRICVIDDFIMIFILKNVSMFGRGKGKDRREEMCKREEDRMKIENSFYFDGMCATS